MQRLSREQLGAIHILQSHFNHLTAFGENCSHLKKKSALLESEFKAFSYSPFKKTKIPREKHWTWNQSNAKASVVLGSGCIVTFRKISPRKKYNDVVAPQFKIWIFHISGQNSMECNFLWCEKGANSIEQELLAMGVKTDIGVIFPNQLTISCLSL